MAYFGICNISLCLRWSSRWGCLGPDALCFRVVCPSVRVRHTRFRVDDYEYEMFIVCSKLADRCLWASGFVKEWVVLSTALTQKQRNKYKKKLKTEREETVLAGQSWESKRAWGPIYEISYNLPEDYLYFVVRSTCDRGLRRAKISLWNIVSQFTNTMLDDLTILQVNCTWENPRALRKMFCRVDDRRNSIVTSVLSSGVAGPLAARGGGQICRPFVLGFGNWRACLKYKSHVMSTVTLVY